MAETLNWKEKMIRDEFRFGGSFFPRYGNKILYGIMIGDEETIKSSFRFELRNLQEKTIEFVETFPGKTFEDKLAEAMKYIITPNKYDDQTKTPIIILTMEGTERFLTNYIEPIVKRYRFLKTGNGQPYFGETSDTDVDNKLVKWNSKISEDEISKRCDSMREMESIKDTYAKIVSIKNNFLSERRKLFGPKSVFASLHLLDHE